MTAPGVGDATSARFEAEYIELYERMWPRLVNDLTRAFGSQATAEECVQQAFERAWKSWGKHDLRNPDAWITRIAVNVARNRFAYDKLRALPEVLRRFGRGAEKSVDPEEVAAGSAVLEAIRKLPDIDRLIVIWYYEEGLTEAEIAERIGRSIRTVQERLTKSRRALRAELIRDGQMPRVSVPAAVEGAETK